MNHLNQERRIGENVNTTGRTHSQEALLRGVANLRDFVENAPEGLRRVGPDGLILWANRTELDMLGYTREEYIGHHIAEFHADAPAPVPADSQRFGDLCPGLAPPKRMKRLVELRCGRVEAANEGAGYVSTGPSHGGDSDLIK